MFSNQHKQPYAQTRTAAATYDAGLRAYFLQIYNYMAGALGITGLVAYITASSPTFMQAIYGTPLQWVVMLAPLGIVFFLGFKIQKMSIAAAQTTFWAFAVLMGLSLSYIFVAYTGVSIARAFFTTACTFGAMSIYGYTTKRDLTGWGSFLTMGLIGIIIAGLVNIFLKSSALYFATSVIGVLIFVGLIAYDTQRLKNTYYDLGGNEAVLKKASIMGALSLYLDFINLFIMLLRLFGERR